MTTPTHVAEENVHVSYHQLQIVERDVIVEVSLAAPRGHVRVVGLMSDVSDDLPVVSHHGPGEYRLRIHARGRDKAAYPTVNDETSGPIERLLVHSWLQAGAAQRVHKTTDRYGAELRRFADSR
ncbi:hypothetical protein [Amycolatopsis sp. NPDC051716]|uniref:hypothetical protein n=1 Tax=Amycolatopsis sp. NPDC051716 TaxID=3155804 RepID=UPI00342C7336